MTIKNFKNILLFIVTIIYFFFAFKDQSFSEIYDLLYQIDLFILISVIFLTTIGLYLTSLRLKFSLKFFKIDTSFIIINKINIFGQLLGSIFNNLFGSIFGRGLIANEYNLIPKIIPFITLYEKLLMLFSMLVINFLLFFYNSNYYENFNINYGLSSFFFTLITILINIFIIFIFFFNNFKNIFKIAIKFLFSINNFFIVTICLCVSIITILSYSLISLNFINNDINILNIFFIFGVVAFISALPISYSGWGIRELSTVYLFQFFGYEQSIGLIAALLMGIISLITLLINYLIINSLKIKTDYKKYLNFDKVEKNFENFILIFTFLSLIFIFINFNYIFKIPVFGNIVSINLSDFFTIIISIIFLFDVYIKKINLKNIWIYKHVPHFLLSFGFFIIYGLIIAYFNNGIGNWALVNKAFGYLILISYFFTGSYFINKFDKSAVNYFVNIFIISGLFIYIFKFLTIGYLSYQNLSFLVWNYENFNSLVYNRNAFAFCLLINFILLININKNKYFIYTTSFLFFLLYLSMSKTAIILIICYLILSLILNKISLIEILKISLCVIILVLINFFTIKDGNLSELKIQILEPLKSEVVEVIPQDLSRQINSIIVPRKELLIIGLKIWKEKPIFGHGLGSTRFMVYDKIDKEKKGISSLSRTPISLHNTFLWIVCETGLVGLIIFIFFPLLITIKILRNKFVNNNKLNIQDFSFLVIVSLSMLFSLTHDILYQRILWIALGIIVSKSILNIKYEDKNKFS